MAKPNGELKIEKGIPVPGGFFSRKSAVTQTMKAMEVGDSVLFPPEHDHMNVRRLAHNVLGAGNYSCRKADGGMRLWRTA